MYNIIIFGSGGFAREVLMLIKQINVIHDQYNVLGFIDNDPNKWGQKINDVEVLGNEEWIDEYYLKHDDILYGALGIGTPHIKRKIIEKVKYKVFWPNLIHPSVIMSNHHNTIGIGNIITAGNILTCNINLHNYITLNLACTVGHETTIEDYVVVSPGVNISGNVKINEGAYLGTGATILEKIIIGKWSTIGGAALINKEVCDNATMVGVPAKMIKQKNEGWHL